MRWGRRWVLNKEFNDDVRQFALNAVVGARLPEAVAEGERGDRTETLSEEPLADGVGEPLNSSVVAGLRDHGVYVSSNYQAW